MEALMPNDGVWYPVLHCPPLDAYQHLNFSKRLKKKVCMEYLSSYTVSRRFSFCRVGSGIQSSSLGKHSTTELYSNPTEGVSSPFLMC